MNQKFENQEEFAGKTVAITGAAGDIGRPLGDEFRRLGGEVFATDLRDTDVPNFTAGDISDPTFVTDWIDKIVDQTGRIDVLVNVAGICPRTELEDITSIDLITAGLLKRGWSEKELAGFYSGNLLRAWKKAEEVAGP